jgi:hypothetical protein
MLMARRGGGLNRIKEAQSQIVANRKVSGFNSADEVLQKVGIS